MSISDNVKNAIISGVGRHFLEDAAKSHDKVGMLELGEYLGQRNKPLFEDFVELMIQDSVTAKDLSEIAEKSGCISGLANVVRSQKNPERLPNYWLKSILIFLRSNFLQPRI